MFKIITLPFKLLRFLIWKPIWHLVYFFLCRPMLTITLLSAGALYLGYIGYNVFDRWTHAVPPRVEQTQDKKPTSYRVSALPPIAGKIRDGNSRFGEDVVVKLTPQENQSYYQEFYQAIIANKDNEPYFWQLNTQTFGKIVPKTAFVSGGGAYCRPFHEVISVHGAAQQSDEVMCQNDTKTGWCRLSTTSTPSCSIGFSSGWDRGIRKITDFSNWF